MGLTLSGNGFGAQGVIILANALGGMRGSLVQLDLSENGLDVTAIEHLADRTGTSLRQLQCLVLKSLWLEPIDAPALIPLLAMCAPTLRSLDLSTNKLGAIGMTHLVDNWPLMPSLIRLNLSQCRFATDEFAAARWLSFIQAMPRVEELILDTCGVGQSAAVLFLIISQLPSTLRVLDVGGSLAGSHMSALVTALPLLPDLR